MDSQLPRHLLYGAIVFAIVAILFRLIGQKESPNLRAQIASEKPVMVIHAPVTIDDLSIFQDNHVIIKVDFGNITSHTDRTLDFATGLSLDPSATDDNFVYVYDGGEPTRIKDLEEGSISIQDVFPAGPDGHFVLLNGLLDDPTIVSEYHNENLQPDIYLPDQLMMFYLSYTGSDPLQIDIQDSDGDGLNDLHENSLGTNPQEEDSDDDGTTDREEIEQGTDPLISEEAAPLPSFQIRFREIDGEEVLQFSNVEPATHSNFSERNWEEFSTAYLFSIDGDYGLDDATWPRAMVRSDANQNEDLPVEGLSIRIQDGRIAIAYDDELYYAYFYVGDNTDPPNLKSGESSIWPTIRRPGGNFFEQIEEQEDQSSSTDMSGDQGSSAEFTVDDATLNDMIQQMEQMMGGGI